MRELVYDDVFPEQKITEGKLTERELDAALDQVRAPTGAGSFRDMITGGVFDETEEQRKFKKRELERIQRTAPELAPVTLPESGDVADISITQDQLTGLAPAAIGFGMLGRQLVSDSPSEFFPGFDQKAYEDLANVPSQTRKFGAQRRKFLADSPIGPRIRDMGSTGLPKSAAMDLRQAATDEDINKILRDNFGAEARLLAPVQVGLDEDDKPIYEKVYQKSEGGEVFRLEVYDDFTSLRELIADVFAMQGGDEKARTRVMNIAGKGLREGQGSVTDLATIVPAAFYAASPTGFVASLGKQFGVALGRAVTLAGTSLAGQIADRYAAGLPALDNLSKIDAIIEGTLGFLGPSAEATFRQVFQGADGFFSRALQRSVFAGKMQGLPKAVAAEIAEEIQLPYGTLAFQNFGKNIVAAAMALRPDVGVELRTRIGTQFKDAIQQRVEKLRRGSKLSNQDIYSIGQFYRQEARNINKQIAELAEIPSDSSAVTAALAAQRNLKELERGIRDAASAMYDRGLASAGPKRQKLEGELQQTINDRLEQIKELATIALNRKAVRTEIDGVEGIENPEQLPVRVEETLKLLQRITRIDAPARNPMSGQVSGVMDQLHTLKNVLNEAVEQGAPPQIGDIRKLLDSSIDDVGKVFTAYGQEAGNFYTGAKETYELLNRSKRAGYVYNALLKGDAEPLQNLVEPLSRLRSSDMMTADNLEVLYTILQYSPREFTKTAFGANAKTIKEASELFRDNMGRAFTAQVGASQDPDKFLRDFLGYTEDVLTRDATDHPVFRFLVPSERQRKNMIDLAILSGRRNREARIFEQVANELFADRGGSSDVARRFYDRVKEEAGSRPEGAKDFFEEGVEQWRSTQTAGSKRILPQAQANLLDKLVNSAITKDVKVLPDGEVVEFERLSLSALQTNIENLSKDEFDKNFMDYILRKNTGLNGLNSVSNLINITKAVADALGDILPAGGDSIAVGAQAAKVTAPESDKINLFKKLIVNKAFVNMLMTPVSRKRLDNILKSDKRTERKGAIILNFLRAETQKYLSENQSVVEYDGKFYDSDSKQLPFRADIFKRIDELKRKQIDDLRGDEGEDRITGSNINLPPAVQSAPIPQAPAGLNIPAPAASGGGGIAALPAPETVQQLQQVGLPLFPGGNIG